MMFILTMDGKEKAGAYAVEDKKEEEAKYCISLRKKTMLTDML